MQRITELQDFMSVHVSSLLGRTFGKMKIDTCLDVSTIANNGIAFH